MTSPEIARAARRHAAAQRQQNVTPPPIFFANVKTVTTGASRDGNAAVSVTWRTTTLKVNAYGETYTPTVGDRVVCLYDGSQVVIVDNMIGWQ